MAATLFVYVAIFGTIALLMIGAAAIAERRKPDPDLSGEPWFPGDER